MPLDALISAEDMHLHARVQRGGEGGGRKGS